MAVVIVVVVAEEKVEEEKEVKISNPRSQIFLLISPYMSRTPRLSLSLGIRLLNLNFSY